MSKSKNFWTTPHDDCWAVKGEGSERASSLHPTQEDAWNEARRRARGAGGEAFLQGKNGRIRARNTYGHDPFPPKG